MKPDIVRLAELIKKAEALGNLAIVHRLQEKRMRYEQIFSEIRIIEAKIAELEKELEQ